MSRVLLASKDYRVRLQGAIFMLNQARSELKYVSRNYDINARALEAELVKPRERRDRSRIWELKFEQTILSDGIAALTGHIAGWEEYINTGCLYDPRAQVGPSSYKSVVGRI